MKNMVETVLHEVEFSGERIEFRLRRSKRKTLAITVRPDTSVLVTAPHGAEVAAVKAKVRRRAVWIRKQRRFFERFRPSMPPRRYVSGETHRFLGRQYRLKVLEATAEKVMLKGWFIYVQTQRKSDATRVRSLVEKWYLQNARIAFKRSFELCLPYLKRHLKSQAILRLRRMPKRWGSWTKRGDICVNPELVKAPSSCIEYVVTHELCHLVHPNHGKEFYTLLHKTMPDWELRKEQLERVMAS